MFNKLKQIKDMRQKAKRMQGLLKDEIVEGTAAGGKIKIKMSGNQEALNVTIDPDFQKSESAERLGGALKDAVNDAVKKAQKVMVRKMQQSGDLKL